MTAEFPAKTAPGEHPALVTLHKDWTFESKSDPHDSHIFYAKFQRLSVYDWNRTIGTAMSMVLLLLLYRILGSNALTWS